MANTTVVGRRNEGTTPRRRAEDADRQLGARLRERRVMLGLTQQHMAELIGVTYQQAHKYEKGINRIAAGRLFTIAQVLGVEVGYFFDGMDSEYSFKPTSQQRMLFDLSRSFAAIQDPRRRAALCDLARVLAVAEPAADEGGRGKDVA